MRRPRITADLIHELLLVKPELNVGIAGWEVYYGPNEYGDPSINIKPVFEGEVSFDRYMALRFATFDYLDEELDIRELDFSFWALFAPKEQAQHVTS